MPTSSPRRGFTLIELMIAVTLGALIVFAAMAGFRVASQTITTANRLALENSLLRAGFQEALSEVDLWTAYDDPQSTAAADQALRRPQMPFSPLPTISAMMASQPAQGQALYRELETDVGWDATYPWPAHAPRTWWRANAAEWHDSKGRSGDYSQFAATSGAPGATSHPWLFRQMDLLQTTLGYYAFCDYLPPSLLYAYTGPDPKQNGKVDLLKEFVTGGDFRSGDGGAWFAQGRYRCTKDESFILVPLRPIGGTGMVTSGNIRTNYTTGVQANEGTVDTLMKRSLSSRLQLAMKPAHWPEVKVDVARFLVYNRFVTLSRFGLSNAITGEHIAISFTAVGTTLRGARQQRKPGTVGSGAGWAKWYGPRNPANDLHLDSPQ